MDVMDHNVIGVKYDDDDFDEIEIYYNGINNVNKYSLNEYILSQHSIDLSTFSSSLTQFSKNSLYNLRTNLEFELVSLDTKTKETNNT